MHEQRGTTLVETLVAVALFSILTLAVTSFLFNVLSQEERTEVVYDVHAEVQNALYDIAESVRGASSVTTPSGGANGTSLELVMFEASLDPTIYSVVGTEIRKSVDGDPAVALTSDAVEVINMRFDHFASAGTPGAVRVEITFIAADPRSGAVSYERTLGSTISLRNYD